MMGTLALERLAPLFVLSIAYADPVPSWPSSFSAVFDEYTWFQGAAQTHRGSIAYWQVHPESYADVPTVAQLALPEACAQALRC